MESIRCPGCMRQKVNRPLCEHCGYNENIDNYPHQLPIGAVLQDRYEVGKVLGQGGFGITYIGWDRKRQFPVAIKEFYPRSLVTRDARSTHYIQANSQDSLELFGKSKARFLKEAHTLARLNDIPEIVRIYNLFEENNTAYMVMEYLKGADLRQYIRMKGGRISLEKTMMLMRPIMDALQRVHEENLVHRDISPDNIMLMPGGVIKLLDFGAAREVLAADPERNLSQSTETILKHGFAPIEQYNRNGNLGPWTDVYALTATMYYCLTGTLPPDAPSRVTDEDTLDWNIHPDLTPGQIRALEQAMEPIPRNRTKSVRELRDAFFAEVPDPERKRVDIDVRKEESQEIPESRLEDWKFSSGGGIVEKNETTRHEPGKKPVKPGRKPWAVIAAAAAAVLVTGAAAVAFLGGREEIAVRGTLDRTISYDSGAVVEMYVDSGDREIGRILRDEDGDILYQFAAEYDKYGEVAEQKVYDGRGKLLRTDTYTYNSKGEMTHGQSRNADGEFLWKGESVYADGLLSTFREEYAAGETIIWTMNEQGNVETGEYFDKNGKPIKTVVFTEYQDLYDTMWEGNLDFREAGKIAARGGPGISPMGAWAPGVGNGGGGAPEKEKPNRPIAVAITEPDEEWEDETGETTAPEELELQIWHDHDDNPNTPVQPAPDVITLKNVKKGDTYRLYALYADGTGAENVEWGYSSGGFGTVDKQGKVTFTGKSGSMTVDLFDNSKVKCDYVVFQIEAVETGEGEDIVIAVTVPIDEGRPTRPEEPVAITEPIELPVSTEVTEAETVPCNDSEARLWVHTKRQELKDGRILRYYEVTYYSNGMVAREICQVNTDVVGFTNLRHEASFHYAGDEIWEQIQTFPDGTEVRIQYIRDICGNLIGQWIRSGEKAPEYEEYDPAKIIVR